MRRSGLLLFESAVKKGNLSLPFRKFTITLKAILRFSLQKFAIFITNIKGEKKHIVHLRKISAILFILFVSVLAFGQSKSKPSDKFKQLDEELPTPNEQRTASGAPGSKYWQN